LIRNLIKKGGPRSKFTNLLPSGNGWLLVEFGADHKGEAEDQARQLMALLEATADAPTLSLYMDNESRERVWSLRESGLGASAFVPGEPMAWEGWEDSAVAPEKVAAYLRDLRKLYDKYDYRGALYGHFGQGCIHTRITFDLMSEAGIRKYRSFIEEATDLVVNYGGSLSGEHGDGQSRAEFLPKMFGPELIQAFREFKSIWDPDWKMNPGKVVDPYRITENLRLGADYAPWDPPTHFHYPEDHGSFASAALRCVGVGKCRREHGGAPDDDTMCPSYMVTREERHSTRGRAHHLWEMLHGDVIQDGWNSDAVHESLDLCLSCKGCKGDCPVNVDMATYKAEFLSHYYEGRLRNRQAYAFGWIDKWSRLASLAPGFFNLFTQLPILSSAAKLAVGMPQSRAIPAFAAEPFKAWWRKRSPRNHGLPPVILWADTFNNYYSPDTAKAAVEVLETAGHQVIVLDGHLCCGRPLYDHGFLDMARSYLAKVLAAMEPYLHLEPAVPVVVLEPSCCSVFRDELTQLFPSHPDARKMSENTFLLSEFLSRRASHFQFPKLQRKAIVQSHCHQKAIMRLDEEKSVMKKIEIDYRLLNSGCCGMAGAFGYEAGEKYEVSLACGEKSLLPEVRMAEPSTIIIANGFSCKSQIEQETNRHALHLAEVMQMALRDGPRGPTSSYPEQPAVDKQKRSLNRSMLRAGMLTAAIGIGALAGAMLLRRGCK
jgi:Fe-S oxidoreductase